MCLEGGGAGLVRTQQKRVTPPGKLHSGGSHWAVCVGGRDRKAGPLL